MTDRYKWVVYPIGQVWDMETGARLDPVEERRILDKMNARMFAATKERPRRE